MLDGNKGFMRKFTKGTMLAIFLFSTVGIGTAKAYYACDTDDVTLSKGDYCIDQNDPSGQTIVKFIKRKESKGFLGTGIGSREKEKIVTRPLTSDEQKALANAASNKSSSSRRGNCGAATNCSASDDSDDDTGDDRGGRTARRARDDSADDTSDDATPTRHHHKVKAASATENYRKLYDWCADLDDTKTPNSIEDRANLVPDTKTKIDDQTKVVADARTAEAAARDKLFACRDQCMTAAIGTGACKLSATDLESVLSYKDMTDNPTVLAYIAKGDPTNYNQPGRFKDSVDATKVCEKMYLNKDCQANGFKDAMAGCSSKNDDGSYFSSDDWKTANDALVQAQKDLKDLQVSLASMQKNPTKSQCSISKASDTDKSIFLTANSDCLQYAKDSCADALADAKSDVSDEIADTNKQCAYCANGNQGNQGNQQVCLTGNCGRGGVNCSSGNCGNNGGISTGAAIAMAFAPAVQSGVQGMFGLWAANRANAACTNAYSTYMTGYTTYQNSSNATGVPPTGPLGPNCGAGGGLAGFGSTGYGLNTGLYGGGLYGNSMYGGYPGMSSGFGLNAGLSLGTGYGAGGYGSGYGMPSSFPAPGGYGTSGYGSTGYGMPSSFPAPSGYGSSMYGQGAYGSMSGIYGGALGQSASNMMGVQQQMYNAQAQMQQMQAQNSVLGASIGGGYPGYAQGGYAQGGYTMPNFGYSSYPQSYGYPNTGSSFSLNAGLSLNAGSNTGYNTGYSSPYSSLYPGVSNSYYPQTGGYPATGYYPQTQYQSGYYPSSYQAPSVYTPGY
jgi:hypothetical protein